MSEADRRAFGVGRAAVSWPEGGKDVLLSIAIESHWLISFAHLRLLPEAHLHIVYTGRIFIPVAGL